jgi:elongation factor Ts
MEELCLLEQKFIKNDKITIRELINQVSSTVGEKIEIKKYIRLSA